MNISGIHSLKKTNFSFLKVIICVCGFSRKANKSWSVFSRISARVILLFIVNYKTQTTWKVIAPVADTENSRMSVIWGVTGQYKRVFTVYCLSRTSCGVVIIYAYIKIETMQHLPRVIGKACIGQAQVRVDCAIAFICGYRALQYKIPNKYIRIIIYAS